MRASRRGAGGISRAMEERMTKEIECDDVVPGCHFTASAPTEEGLIKQVAEHAAQAHGVKELSPELAAKVKAAIQTR